MTARNTSKDPVTARYWPSFQGKSNTLVNLGITTFDGYLSHDLMCPGVSDCRIALLDTR